MKITFSQSVSGRDMNLALLVARDAALPELTAVGGEALTSYLRHAMKLADFTGKKRKTLRLIAPGESSFRHVLLVGAGDPAMLTPHDFELLGGEIAGAMAQAGCDDIVVHAALAGAQEVAADESAARLASGMVLRNYRFGKYKTIQAEKGHDAGGEGGGNDRDRDLSLLPVLRAATIVTAKASQARARFSAFDAVAYGVHLARDLVNEPANVLNPRHFADRARDLSELGLKVEVLKPRDMEELGMGALLAVSRGSRDGARLVVMRWRGGAEDQSPLAFVGKGVTFDSGGISLKPAAGMEDMKGDMGGAACVTGLMAALARRRAQVNAVGVIGCVENMPGNKAQRPGDIVTSMSGQTIAVLNTDAEGRLVLADTLWYAQKRFKPRFVINLATLTGAIMIALGQQHAGLFSNDDELAEQLRRTGLTTGEKVWRLPLSSDYDKMLKSDIADMQNIGGRMAGSITAAQFLKRFVKDVPWAHLDIAGVAFDAPKTAINRSWGSGWGVRLLNELIATHYESQ